MKKLRSCQYLTWLFAVLLAPKVLHASQAPNNLPRRLWQDQCAIASSPLRLDASSAWVWAPTAMALGILMPNYGGRRSLDERVVAGIDRDDGVYPRMMKVGTHAGDGRVLFGLSLVGYGAGRWGQRPELERFSANWFEALANASLWVTAIKFFAGRNRPGGPVPRSRFTGPAGYMREQGQNSSFPSGHSALAFASAAVISNEFDNNPRAAISAYSVAGLIGFSRIYAEKHWLSDVVAGAALGYGIGRLVMRRQQTKGTLAFSWQPAVGPDRVGLSLNWRY